MCVCNCMCVGMCARGRKIEKKQDDRLYYHFNGIKFHRKSYFQFNLDKTLKVSSDPFSVPLLPYLPQTHYVFLTSTSAHTRSLMCAYAHTRGCYQAAVCLKCCFYIAAIFHFGLLSLNCLWGFEWVEEPSHLYMRLKEKKERWETCLCSYSFSSPSSNSLYAVISPRVFHSL